MTQEERELKNLDLWKRVETTKTTNVKNAKLSGRNVTAICPQSQKKEVTKEFGIYGVGWGVHSSNSEFIPIEIPEGTALYIKYTAVFFIVLDGEKHFTPVQNTIEFKRWIKPKNYNGKSSGGYWSIDADALKKVETDSMTKWFSNMGFNADVFMGKFDDNKYVQELALQEQQEQTLKNAQKAIQEDNSATSGFADLIDQAPNMQTLIGLLKGGFKITPAVEQSAKEKIKHFIDNANTQQDLSNIKGVLHPDWVKALKDDLLQKWNSLNK